MFTPRKFTPSKLFTPEVVELLEEREAEIKDGHYRDGADEWRLPKRGGAKAAVKAAAKARAAGGQS